MKDLKDFINESKYFKLESNEREALSSLVGVLCGALGDDEIEEKCGNLIKELTDEEKKQLDDLYMYVLDDEQTYRSVNSRMIKDELPLIKKIIEWLDKNDAWVSNNDYELLDVLDKINNK